MPDADGRTARGQGLKYTRFHTTALCSPTRAALLSGRNHHAVGMGGITEIATSAPGYNSLRPNTCAPLAETLKLNGYSTAQFGKCHEVPVFESSPDWAVPSLAHRFRLRAFLRVHRRREQSVLPGALRRYDADPAGRTPEEGYHLTEDLADQGDRLDPAAEGDRADKPFFVYFAPGACHAPHPCPEGVDCEIQRQIRPGLGQGARGDLCTAEAARRDSARVRADPRPKDIPAWEETEERLRPVLARQMEIFAAFLEHADYHAGRLIDALADLGILDDTLIYYIIGDNGASSEGSLIGALNDKAAGEAPDLTRRSS